MIYILRRQIIKKFLVGLMRIKKSIKRSLMLKQSDWSLTKKRLRCSKCERPTLIYVTQNFTQYLYLSFLNNINYLYLCSFLFLCLEVYSRYSYIKHPFLFGFPYLLCYYNSYQILSADYLIVIQYSLFIVRTL